MRHAFLLALAVAMLAPQAQAVSLYMPFSCGTTAHITPGSPFHTSYEVDWNVGSGSDDLGLPAVASASGTVTFAAFTGCGFGNKVVVDHGNGATTMYAHLDVITVGVGDHVNAGDAVGRVGNTGQCPSQNMTWSPHLHQEYRVNGVLTLPYYMEIGYVDGRDMSLNGIPFVSENCGTDPPGNTGFGYSRVFATGQGVQNPYAWERARIDVGGPNELGLAIESPHWDSGYVVQRHRRLDDRVDNLLVHDQNVGVPRAVPVIDAFYRAFVQFGGLGRLGAPISKKYQTSPTSWRQDFQYSYIVLNDGQAPLNYGYASGYTPGQGASQKSLFEVAYGQLGGAMNVGDPKGRVTTSGGLEWQDYQHWSGTTSKLVAIPSGYIRAFQLKGSILSSYNAKGGAGVFGPPLSDEVDMGNKQKRQYFRYATFNYDGNTGVVSVTKTARQYAPGETVTPATSANYLRDAFERNGGYAKLGICTAPYFESGYVYQYCAGGTSANRAAVILNPSAGNYVAFVVRAGIEGYYESVGGISGVMGTPISDEYLPNASTTNQDFGHKRMSWYSYVPHVSDYAHSIAIGEGTGYPTAFHFMWNLDAVHVGAPQNAGHWWHYKNGTSMLQDFDGGTYNGTVTFLHNEPDRAPRAFELRGGVRTAYFSMGGPDSYLGRPVSDEVSSNGYTRQYFEGGYIDGYTSTAVYNAHKY